MSQFRVTVYLAIKAIHIVCCNYDEAVCPYSLKSRNQSLINRHSSAICLQFSQQKVRFVFLSQSYFQILNYIL